MSLVIPPGYGTATFELGGAVGTAPYCTTLGLDLVEAGGDWVGAANAAKNAFQEAFRTNISDALVINRVSLLVNDGGDIGSVDSSTAPAACTKTGNFPPTALSLIARKVTALNSRRGKGRMYIPGLVSELDVDEAGRVEPASVTAFQGRLDLFYAALLDNIDIPTPPVLFHSEGVIGAATPTPITKFTVAPLVGWIRGRIR